MAKQSAGQFMDELAARFDRVEETRDKREPTVQKMLVNTPKPRFDPNIEKILEAAQKERRKAGD